MPQKILNKKSCDFNFHLLLLPNEILQHILSYCSYKTLLTLSQTCRRLREVTNQESVWSILCYKDYDVTSKGDSFVSFSDLYKNFLCKYGHMLGIYTLNFPNYKGLAEIEFQDGLNVWQWKQNFQLSKNPIQKRALFRIERPTIEGKARIFCCGTDEIHEATLLKNGQSFTLKCLYPKFHNEEVSKGGLQEMFHVSGILDGLSFHPLEPHHLDIPDFLRTQSGELPDSLIEPGLFRVVSQMYEDYFIIFQYRCNGALIGFRVALEDSSLVKHNYRVNTNHALCPSWKQQSSIEALSVLSGQRTGMNCTYEHEFHILPSYMVEENMKRELRICKARFPGFGRLKSGDFQKIHFVIFNNERIGIVWLELATLTLFERVKYTFRVKGRVIH